MRPSRRDLLKLGAMALVAPGLEPARAQTSAAAPARWPGKASLEKNQRELLEALARVPLSNGDPPDLLPRARNRKGGA